MTNPPDDRPLLQDAFAQATTLVEGVTADQLDRPTACTDFDVRALLAHLRAVADRVAALPTGVDIRTLPTSVDGGDDFATRAERAVAAWADDDTLLTRTMTVPWGQLPGFAVLGGYVMEVVTHSWDLADATGRTAQLDDDLSRATLAIARQHLPEARDGTPFAPPVPAPAGADPHTELAGWMGRRSVAAG